MSKCTQAQLNISKQYSFTDSQNVRLCTELAFFILWNSLEYLETLYLKLSWKLSWIRRFLQIFFLSVLSNG